MAEIDIISMQDVGDIWSFAQVYPDDTDNVAVYEEDLPDIDACLDLADMQELRCAIIDRLNALLSLATGSSYSAVTEELLNARHEAGSESSASNDSDDESIYNVLCEYSHGERCKRKSTCFDIDNDDDGPWGKKRGRHLIPRKSVLKTSKLHLLHSLSCVTTRVQFSSSVEIHYIQCQRDQPLWSKCKSGCVIHCNKCSHRQYTRSIGLGKNSELDADLEWHCRTCRMSQQIIEIS